ncbi:MAG: hypothetical protein ABSG70_09890, partial [Terriglobales bacterium]
MKHSLLIMCFAVLAASTALAQGKKDVPPPPKPDDDAPSLEVTMKFIQDKVNGIGPVNFVLYTHDNVTGSDQTNQFKVEVTKVLANPSACHIAYHLKDERDRAVVHDLDAEFYLKNVEDVVVTPMEQGAREIATAQGHPSSNVSADPPVFLFKVRMTDKRYYAFDFLDEQLANRVAKAMVRAVELCGGGSKDVPPPPKLADEGSSIEVASRDGGSA